MPRPAPVTAATRPSNLRDSGSDGGLEAEEPAQGAAENGGAVAGGDTGEKRLDQLLAAAERALGVRIVGPPNERGQASDVAAGDRHRVVLELDVELAPHVLARLERVRPLLVDVEHPRHLRLIVGGPALVPVAEPPVRVLADAGDPGLVHPAEERRQPVGVEFDETEVELGIPLRNTAG